MNEFEVHLIGKSHPLRICVDHDVFLRLQAGAKPSEFISCWLADADQDGVMPRAMISVGRIQCIIEANA